MKEFEQVQIESRQELHDWLAANHTRTESIWLVTFKKHVTDRYVIEALVGLASHALAGHDTPADRSG
jgi:hypothetical protein